MAHAAHRDGRTDLDGRGVDDITENYGHLARAHGRVRAGQDGTTAGAGLRRRTSDTTVFPAAAAGGTGLAVGGSSNVATPAAGYVD